MEEEDEEDDEHRNHHSRHHLRQGLGVLLRHAAHFPFKVRAAFGQFFAKLVSQLVSVISAHRFADDGYGAHAVASYDAAVMP